MRLTSLPAGEREIIKLIAKQVLRAVCDSFRYRETVAVISCGNHTFTAKGKIVENVGWKIYNEKEQTDKVKFYLFAMFTIIPAVTGSLGIIPMLFYDLNNEKRERMYAELLVRREEMAKKLN